MDAEEFRTHGREMVDYIAGYIETVAQRRTFPDVKPGYLKELIPDEAPQKGEKWEDVKKDIERVIMPGVTHWHSPHFHAYFPCGNSFPSLLGNMLSDGIGCIGFSWASCPAATELEMSVLDWLGQMLKLPEEFLFKGDGKGGGVIQGSASEATLIALLSARTTISNKLRKDNPDITQGQIIDKLVAYTSDQAHSSVDKAGQIGVVKMKSLETDANGSLRGETLEAAIQEDVDKGLVPFFLCATLGTTSACTYDNLKELGPVCNKYDVWMHVDAAYAGSAFICPEYRHLLDGVEHAMSFCFNPHKWLNVHFDCSAMWVKDQELVSGSFNVNPLFLRHSSQGQLPDYRHWQIPLGRRFRSLKLWFVLRMYGVEKLQQKIRKDVSLAKHFEQLVLKNDRFEIYGTPSMGLVCFRLKGSNEMNECLHEKIIDDGRIHLVPAKIRGTYFLRFAVCARSTQESNINFSWSVIQELAGTSELEQRIEI